MTSYFPDINVWLALAAPWHPHSNAAWRWARSLQSVDEVVLTRHVELGFLRLLCTEQVMGGDTLNIGAAWEIYAALAGDLRAELRAEPRGVSEAFQRICIAKSRERAPKFLADAYLIAFAKSGSLTLVTFDRAMLQTAKSQRCQAVRPA